MTEHLVLRVPGRASSTTSASSSSSREVFFVASAPCGSLPADARFTLETQPDHPSRRKIACVTERTVLTAKNYGRNACDKAQNRVERVLVFAVSGDQATLVSPAHAFNEADAGGGVPFIFSQMVKPEAVAEGNSTFEPIKDQVDAEDAFALDKTFGSRKRQRAEARRVKAQVSAKNIGGQEDLDTSLAALLHDGGQQQTQQENKHNALTLLLPPFDEHAENPVEAYPREGVFPADERQGAWELAQFADVDEETGTTRLESKYAQSRFRILDEEEERRLCAYFECMFRFITRVRNIVSRVGEVQKSMGPFSDAKLVESLLSRFMEARPEHLGGGWGKSDFLKHKALINLLLVALHLESFSLNQAALHAIATDLKVDATKVLEPLLRKIGCRREVGSKTWKLTAPLRFPVEGKRMFKRR